MLRQYIGGSGLGTRLVLDEGGALADPLSPEAPLVFAFSPLVGTPLTTSAKFAVVSRSPLTERINDSLAGSGFALAGKRCGCDAIVIVGRANRLSVLVIDDGDVRLEPAEELRGDSCPDTEEKVRARFGADFRIASIGPAGERGVRYATISHDRRHAGRGGSGAVLGSKNIKAVAVRGTRRCEWADPDALIELSRDLSARSFGPATAKYRELGTATNMLTLNRFGALPTRNFQRGHVRPGVEPVAGGARHGSSASPRELCRVHHRLRAPLRTEWRGRARRIRKPLCPRLALRRRGWRRGAAGIAALRRARHRHHQHRRHHRLRDGMRGARPARPGLAHLRQRRRRPQGDRSDWPA